MFSERRRESQLSRGSGQGQPRRKSILGSWQRCVPSRISFPEVFRLARGEARSVGPVRCALTS
jgi:hypothetical protein